MTDVLVVGAGPGGLSAALLLGRCRRRVLVCDGGKPRNASSRGLHGFLSRDGAPPAELLRIAREQLDAYPSVELRDVEVKDVRAVEDGFEASLGDGAPLFCRKLVLATGVVDVLPRIEGLEALYGRSVFHCPYCDGWEMRDQPLAAYGPGRLGFNLALELIGWSEDLVLCTDGPAGLRPRDRKRLERCGIGLREERVARLEGRNGVLKRVVFADGSSLDRRGLFFNCGWKPRSDLPAKLGCRFTPKGAVETGEEQTTNVPGVYAVGDASTEDGLTIGAAAEGVRAALAINREFLKEDLARRDAGAVARRRA